MDRRVFLGLLLCTMADIAASLGGADARAYPAQERLANPGFEANENGHLVGWTSFEQGYELSSDRRSGATCIRCVNATADDRRGATAVVVLNQSEPRPIVVEGYSRAENVGGFRNNDYSIYLDLTYMDGTPLWGQTAPFSVGTHDWQRRRVLVCPVKPVRVLYVHALFRHHTGTAWFDDFSVRELDPGSVFDGQALEPPRLGPGESQGWFVRDVEASSAIASYRDARRLSLSCRLLADGSKIEVSDLTGRPRCITIYYAVRVVQRNLRWWHDMRRSVPCAGKGEYANVTRLGVGATGTQSLYPLACVAGPRFGRAVAIPPSQGACVARLGYHAGAGLLYVGFDVALYPSSKYNSRDGHGLARVAVVSWPTDPRWGFRAALRDYYRRFPEAFARRSKKDGLWIPFTDPSTVEGLADFGIAYHEGDNSVASDDRLGILSFRYTEPMTWWMPMAPEVPRTYEAAVELLHRYLAGNDRHQRQLAQSVIHSGSHDAQGRFNVEFQNAPWTNGAVWVLNPNPLLPSPAGEATKASMAFGPEVVERLYAADRQAVLDGEYLDSLEGWADVLDYRKESLEFSTLPPTFSQDELRPVVPTWFSVYELARHMRNDLLRRGKLLMANATPWRIHAFAPLLDVMGTETNWLPGGTWQPDSDAIFCLRRALCYQKPYLLLQNTDFDRFRTEHVERYMQRCMFYAVFPSMFSADASTRNYWTQPQWYNRDRHLFKRYVPLIARLSAAGWQPVTGAVSSNPDVLIERYGSGYLTVFNGSDRPTSSDIIIDPAMFTAKGSTLTVSDAVAQNPLAAERIAPRQTGGNVLGYRLHLAIGPEECKVLHLTWIPSRTRQTRGR